MHFSYKTNGEWWIYLFLSDETRIACYENNDTEVIFLKPEHFQQLKWKLLMLCMHLKLFIDTWERCALDLCSGSKQCPTVWKIVVMASVRFLKHSFWLST